MTLVLFHLKGRIKKTTCLGFPVTIKLKSDSVALRLPFLKIPGYEEITKAPLDGFGAVEKCGEGSTKGLKICVPYYMCDGQTNTIVQSGKMDGFGDIDIRLGANSCEHFLDVCCKLPTGGSGTDVIPPPTSPIPDHSEPPIPPPASPNYCGIRNNNGIDFKITGNKNGEAEYGEFPWMVAILKKNYNPSVDPVLAVCGGSLIAPKVVLTGAHCVHSFKPQDLKIRAGEWDTQTDKERLPYQERNIVQVVIHDQFNPKTLFNDFALLILDRNLKKAENIGTICLPKQSEVVKSRNCFATGWGKDVFEKEGQFQVILKKIELPIVEHNECQNALRQTRLGALFNLDESFICAGGELGKDTCTGDGGSPLVCPDPSNPNRYVQAGIVAWGIGCGESNVPGVYADVSKFRTWVDEHMQKLGLDTRPYNL